MSGLLLSRRFVKRGVSNSCRSLTSQSSTPPKSAKNEDENDHHKSDLFASKLGVAVDTLLVIAKGAVGLTSGSAALTADAAHSGADMFSSAVVHLCVKEAQVPADQNHPYGHGKIQSLGTLIVGGALVMTGGGIGVHSLSQMMSYFNDNEIISDVAITNPEMLGPAILVAAGSVLAKEALYRYTLRAGELSSNNLLVASAWHHRSDALSSVVALIGVGGTFLGFSPLFDPLAGFVVSIMIGKVGVEAGYDAAQELTDADMTSEEKAHLVEAVNAVICHTKEWDHFHPFELKKLKQSEHPYEDSLISSINEALSKSKKREKESNKNKDHTIISSIDFIPGSSKNEVGKVEELEEEPESKPIVSNDVDTVISHDKAIMLQRLRTRRMGPYIMVDVDIEVPPKISASAAHQVAEHIRRSVVLCDKRVNEVNVHVDPRDAQHFRPRRWMINGSHDKETNDEKGFKEKIDSDNIHNKIMDQSNSAVSLEDMCVNHLVETNTASSPLMPMPHEVEEHIRQSMKNIPDIITKYDVHISEVQCYYQHDKLFVKMDILLPPHKSITEANRVARGVRLAILAQCKEIYDIDIDLELDEGAGRGIVK